MPATFAVIGIESLGLSQKILHIYARFSLQSLEFRFAPDPVFHAVTRRTLAACTQDKKEKQPERRGVPR